jgi:hypothetical protein
VYLRVRPPRPEEAAVPSPLDVLTPTTVQLTPPASSGLRNMLRFIRPEAKPYSFTGVFAQDVGQDQVFEKTALPLIRDCFEGKVRW